MDIRKAKLKTCDSPNKKVCQSIECPIKNKKNQQNSGRIYGVKTIVS